MACELDLGNEAIDGLLERLDLEPECARQERGLAWQLWGAEQRVSAEAATPAGPHPSWVLQLRTCAIEGFTGSPAQSTTLSDRLAFPTLAGVVPSAEQPTRLELASRLKVHRENIAWARRALVVVARVQALEARRLSESKGLAWVGLRPGADARAEGPSDLIAGLESEAEDSAWPEAEIADCLEVLALLSGADAVRISRGLIATFSPDGTREPRSILEVKADAVHPLLGRGLSVALKTPIPSAPLNAMVANALELGPWGSSDALGGWWAPHGGLLHYRGFYPDALYREGFALDLLLAHARRARGAMARPV